jgi:hypothetical protein
VGGGGVYTRAASAALANDREQQPQPVVGSNTTAAAATNTIQTKQVQWYERRANMPAHLQEGMHDREVVEWLQTDQNLVGCIERKARVLKAGSYEEAAAQLPAGEEAADGDWYFCRGVLEVDTLHFTTYEEVAAGEPVDRSLGCWRLPSRS